ncbi:LacI family DNA-binding transcriptional regulator [Actinacidiphila sp. bgisy144]|uniref:LacI family DNA-binding transcriptional regulator n=1 Tax=unclassified Actinacidiphila TaxID=2995708 RepID=UPI003EB7B4CE
MSEENKESARPRKATVRDVAERAGVSISTVSKALSGKGAVRHETRQRVLQAAEALKYQSSQLATSLYTGRTDMVGVIAGDTFGRLAVPVLLGVIEALAEREVALLLCDGRGDPIREQFFAESLLRRRVDGILVVGSGASPREPIGADLPVPVVYALEWSTRGKDVSVVPDDAEGARSAARHLVATGRRRIAFISGPGRDVATKVRLAGTQEVLAGAGGRLVHEPLLGHWTEGWGRQAAIQLLRAGEEFDGIACGSDQIARGVLDVLRENEVRVPQDVGVVGFDNWDVMVEASRPQLSSVDMSLTEVGRTAAQLLLASIEEDVPPGIHRIDCHLVPRESTALA